MNCVRCHAPLEPNVRFCGNCGMSVSPPSSAHTRRRNGRSGCAIGCLSTLLILALLGVVAWVFGVRPYLHNIAEAQLNSALSAAVNQLPANASQLPAGSIVVSQNTLNNLLVLNLPPSNAVQQPNIQITPAEMRLDFQLYGQPCSITGVPTAQNGKLVFTNTSVHGILSAVLSPNDIATLLNKHLADALGRINHTVQGVSLKSQEMDVTLN